MNGVNLKITPLTIEEFIREFSINPDKENIYKAYREYLEVNKKHHHYSWLKNIDAWYGYHIARR